MLRPLGARVEDASDTWQVMSLLLATGDSVDLVISDLPLPAASRISALASARAAGIEVPFLFLSTADSPAVHCRTAALGAAILEKPVVAGQLLACARQMCRPRRAWASSGPGDA